MAHIYLSSTVADLQKYREAAIEVIHRHGHLPFSVEATNNDSPPSPAQLAAVDLFVLIVARRYRQFADAEYASAKGTNKPIVVFTLRDEAPLPFKSSEPDSASLEEAELPREPRVTYFSSVPDFAKKLGEALTLWDAERAQSPTIAFTVDELCVAWRLVVGSFADPELLRNLDPQVFVEALEKWEGPSADRSAPWPERLARARKALESTQSDAPSALWLAWMGATRAAKSPVAPVASGGPPA